MLTKKIIFLSAFLLSSIFIIKGESAEALMKQGKYLQAAEAFAKSADAKPSDALANALTAEAYLWARDLTKANEYKKRAGVHSTYVDAVQNMLNYNLEAATELLEKYTSGKNAKTANTEKAEQLEKRIEQTQTMLERVEKIVVVDSLQVPRDKFFTFYRLSADAGSLLSPAQLPEGLTSQKNTAVFRTQIGNKMMWGAPDADGNIRIVESAQLADGTWETPHPIDGAVNAKGAKQVSFPYILSDGVTMYFASNDPETSFGGLDIYISRFDGDKYLEPQNLGMPYNSAYDDFMFVIDETNSVGWWATDRNAEPGMVTIYTFQPSDLRVNYPIDTPNLPALAMLSNITLTQPADFAKAQIIEKISNSSAALSSSKLPEFKFALPNGKVITNPSQLKNQQATEALEYYLDYRNEYEQTCAQLNNLRNEYRNGNKEVASKILDLEGKQLRMQRELTRLSNLVISAEKLN